MNEVSGCDRSVPIRGPDDRVSPPPNDSPKCASLRIEKTAANASVTAVVRRWDPAGTGLGLRR